MTIGWAIILAAVLLLVDKYGLYRKVLRIAGLGTAVTVALYVIVYGFVTVMDRWEEHQKQKQMTANQGMTFDSPPITASSVPPTGPGWGPPITAQPILSKESGWETVPAPPRGFTPVTRGREFLLKDAGSDVYFKAVCYNETTEQPTERSKANGGQKVCNADSIVMEEVP